MANGSSNNTSSVDTQQKVTRELVMSPVRNQQNVNATAVIAIPLIRDKRLEIAIIIVVKQLELWRVIQIMRTREWHIFQIKHHIEFTSWATNAGIFKTYKPCNLDSTVIPK